MALPSLEGSPIWAAALLLPLLLLLISDRRKQIRLPRVGADPGILKWKIWYARYKFFKHGGEYTKESYQKYKDSACKMQTMMSEYVVVGPAYMQHIRNLPESKLSSSAALVESVLGKYNGVDINLKDNLSGDMVRGPFTRMIPQLVPSLVEELEISLKHSLNLAPGDTKRLKAYTLMYNTINDITSRVFIGAPLCRDKRWTHAVAELPDNIFAIMGALFIFPDWIRRLIAPWLPATKRLAANLSGVRDILYPDGKLVEFKQDQVTAFQLLAQASKNNDTELELVQRIVLLTAAALHTSCTQLVHAMFDMCARREYFAPLRKEASEALASTDGVWTMETLRSLPRLDSFIKESQRLSPSNLLGFGRLVMSPIALPDGTVLPAGTAVRAASTEMAVDPDFYPDPEVFDGRRFFVHDPSERVRDKEYVGIEEGNVSWGTGRFTCPGRWYASAMIRLVLGKLLVEYDFEFPDGQTEIPPWKTIDTRVMPNSEQGLVFSRR